MNDKLQTWGQTFFADLRRLADAAMRREHVGHTLQPTALVNEAFLILVRQRNLDIENRAEFLAAAANTIRRVLVDHARRRQAEKRGGPDGRQVPLQVAWVGRRDDIDLTSVHEALEALAVHSERAARIVELRFFAGLTGEEIADTIGISLRTVNNDWKFAKVWLYRKIGELERRD